MPFGVDEPGNTWLTAELFIFKHPKIDEYCSFGSLAAGTQTETLSKDSHTWKESGTDAAWLF